MADDDFALLDAWRAGDAKAANELFDRYFGSLYAFFRTKVEDGAAEDLVQQTFLSCVQAIEGFRKEASFRTYLFRAARSRLYNLYDARRRRAQVFDPAATSCADLGVEPSFLGTAQEQQRLLLQALRAIPLELQVALELYYFFERMRAPQLAEILELPEGTVRTRLRRGLELLRQRLGELHRGERAVEETMTNLQAWADGIRAGVLGRPGDDRS
jgi:RNA polymerase sigma factor (sigma-70 family)